MAGTFICAVIHAAASPARVVASSLIAVLVGPQVACMRSRAATLRDEGSAPASITSISHRYLSNQVNAKSYECFVHTERCGVEQEVACEHQGLSLYIIIIGHINIMHRRSLAHHCARTTNCAIDEYAKGDHEHAAWVARRTCWKHLQEYERCSDLHRERRLQCCTRLWHLRGWRARHNPSAYGEAVRSPKACPHNSVQQALCFL